MKTQKGLFVMAAILIAALASLAKNARTITLRTPVMLQGAQISAGQYEVSWVSHSPTATVTFAQRNATVATAEAKWSDREVSYPDDAVVYTTNPDGSHTLEEVRFGGTKRALVFGKPN